MEAGQEDSLSLSIYWIQARMSQCHIMIFYFCSWRKARKRRSMQRLYNPAVSRKPEMAIQRLASCEIWEKQQNLPGNCDKEAKCRSRDTGCEGINTGRNQTKPRRHLGSSLAPLHYTAIECILMAEL